LVFSGHHRSGHQGCPLYPQSRYVQHPNECPLSARIIAKVWDDVAVTEDSLAQCVVDIRKAIGDEERRVLRTVARQMLLYRDFIKAVFLGI
jgi:hypothetical protein